MSKANVIRVMALGIEQKNNNDKECIASYDFKIDQYDEIHAAIIATKIVELIEEGIIPVDIWDCLIKIIVIEGFHPTTVFYQMIIDTVKETPLDV